MGTIRQQQILRGSDPIPTTDALFPTFLTRHSLPQPHLYALRSFNVTLVYHHARLPPCSSPPYPYLFPPLSRHFPQTRKRILPYGPYSNHISITPHSFRIISVYYHVLYHPSPLPFPSLRLPATSLKFASSVPNTVNRRSTPSISTRICVLETRSPCSSVQVI